jgi:hypothetical protein
MGGGVRGLVNIPSWVMSYLIGGMEDGGTQKDNMEVHLRQMTRAETVLDYEFMNIIVEFWTQGSK